MKITELPSVCPPLPSLTTRAPLIPAVILSGPTLPVGSSSEKQSIDDVFSHFTLTVGVLPCQTVIAMPGAQGGQLQPPLVDWAELVNGVRQIAPMRMIGHFMVKNLAPPFIERDGQRCWQAC